MCTLHMRYQTTISINQVCAQFNKKNIDLGVIFLSKHHLYQKHMRVCPLHSSSPSERNPPKLYVDQISDDAQAKGNKLKINAGGTDEMRRRHQEERWSWRGAATVSGQTVKRERTLRRRGKLSPSCLSPAPPYTLFIVHKWAGINSFNLELNVLTLVCLPHT